MTKNEQMAKEVEEILTRVKLTNLDLVGSLARACFILEKFEDVERIVIESVKYVLDRVDYEVKDEAHFNRIIGAVIVESIHAIEQKDKNEDN
jgi:hypothetical protein